MRIGKASRQTRANPRCPAPGAEEFISAWSLFDHVMFSHPQLNRSFLDDVDDLGYGTVDQLVHERSAEVFDGFCLLAREV